MEVSEQPRQSIELTDGSTTEADNGSKEARWTAPGGKRCNESPQQWKMRLGRPKMPSVQQFWGLFLTTLFYADLTTDWMVVVNFFREGGGGSNCWIPVIMILFLFITGAISILTINQDENKNFELYSKDKNVRSVQYAFDFLGLSLARLFPRLWGFNFDAGICRMLCFNKFMCSTCCSMLLTSYVIATQCSSSLSSFEVETYVWVCWGVSVTQMCFTFLPGDTDDEQEYITFGVFRLLWFLSTITTPFICVFWWSNVGFYGVVMGWCALICMIGGALDTPEGAVFIAMLTFLAMSIIQVYFMATQDFTSDALILAGFGTAVAVLALLVMYVVLGYIAVNTMFQMVRSFINWIR